jgi:hypothetical protein
VVGPADEGFVVEGALVEVMVTEELSQCGQMFVST